MPLVGHNRIRRPLLSDAPRVRVSLEVLGRANGVPGVLAPEDMARTTFQMAKPLPGVLPKGRNPQRIAMDREVDYLYNYAAMGAVYAEGLQFMGYQYLAELTQRPEYRRPAEILAKEMTRQWLKFKATGDENKDDKIKLIEAEFKRLKVQDRFRKLVEMDGFFGRAQLFIDMGHDTKDPVVMKSPLLDSTKTVKKGKAIVRLTLVEPVWTYPNFYDSFDPLSPQFYNPQTWFVMGKEIHASRLMTLVSREVPDLLKPAYSFGGLSLSQMGKPYVDNWLRTRQSVSDLIHSFSTSVLAMNMAQLLNSNAVDEFYNRLDLYNKLRDNRGILAVDKDTEEFSNVSAPLGTLDALQAQSQEHMSAVFGIPLIILFGITPKGLNATSEDERKTFYSWLKSQQESDLSPKLERLLHLVQLTLFGEVDPEIGFEWNPLWELSEEELATARKTEVETDGMLIDKGIILPEEARRRVALQDESPYAGLDLDIDITPPAQEDGMDPLDDDGDGPDDQQQNNKQDEQDTKDSGGQA